MSLKKTLSISLPVTIVLFLLLLFISMGMNRDDVLYTIIASIGGLLFFAAIIQAIFWKFVKWTF